MSRRLNRFRRKTPPKGAPLTERPMTLTLKEAMERQWREGGIGKPTRRAKWSAPWHLITPDEAPDDDHSSDRTPPGQTRRVD